MLEYCLVNVFWFKLQEQKDKKIIKWSETEMISYINSGRNLDDNNNVNNKEAVTGPLMWRCYAWIGIQYK